MSLVAISNGITLAPVTWSNTVQYSVNAVYGIPGGNVGAPLIACPQVNYSGITYIANQFNTTTNQFVQPTLGMTPNTDSAWVQSSAGSNVLDTPLTGFAAAAGTITSSDTVLSAFNKTQGNINNITGSYLFATLSSTFTTQALSFTPYTLTIGSSNFTVVKSSDITYTGSTTINLPTGKKYFVAFGVQADTFSAVGIQVLGTYTVTGVLNAVQSASSGYVVSAALGSQGTTSIIIDATGGAQTLVLNLATTSGTAALNYGDNLFVQIYSL